MATRKSVNLCKAAAVLLAVQLLICVQCNEGGGGGGATFDYVPRNSSSFSFVNASDNDEYSTAVGWSTLSSETNGHHCYSSSESTSKNSSNNNDISRDTEIDKLSCDDGDFSTNGGNVSTCSCLPPLNGWKNKTNPPPSFTLQTIPPRSSGFASTTGEDDKTTFSTNDMSNISCIMKSCFEAGTWSTISTTDATTIAASVLLKNKLKRDGRINEISNFSEANVRNTLEAGEKEEAGILSSPPLPTSILSPPMYPTYINGTTEKDEKSPHSPNNLKRLLQQLEVSRKRP